MRELVLTRFLTANNATLGKLDGLTVPIFTLEDQWRNNKAGDSCIPTGTYYCSPHGWEASSPVKFKQVWLVQNVPGRDAILLHAGNTHQDTHGCVLLGLGLIVNQMVSMVTDSRLATNLLRKDIGKSAFTLKIV